MPGKKPATFKPVRPEARAKAQAPDDQQPAIAALARRHAEAAIAALIEVVGDRAISPAARISAASALLNWGFGKSVPAGDDGNEGPAELVIRWRNAQDGLPGPTTAKAKPRPKPKS